MENAMAAISGTICMHKVTQGDFKGHCCIMTGLHSRARRHGVCFNTLFLSLYFRLLTLCLLSVCDYVCSALKVWYSSVAEKTTSFRAVRPSAAREWQKSSQPGVTTDLSVKVRNRSRSASAPACKPLTPPGQAHRRTAGERSREHTEKVRKGTTATKCCSVALASPRRKNHKSVSSLWL